MPTFNFPSGHSLILPDDTPADVVQQKFEAFKKEIGFIPQTGTAPPPVAPVKSTSPWYVEGPRQFASGAAAGMAGVPDLPFNIANAGINIGGKMIYGKDFEPKDIAPWHAQRAAEQYLPAPAEGYETWRHAGEIAAPVATMGLPGLLRGGVGAAVRSLTPKTVSGGALRTGLTTGGVMFGENAGSSLGTVLGQAMDQNFGGGGRWESAVRDLGNIAGGTAGAGWTTGVKKSEGGYLRQRYGEPESASRYQAALDLGVPPSVGLVGNKLAGLKEDVTATGSWGGGPATEMRKQQYEALDRATQGVAADVRGGPSTEKITQGTVGSQVNAAATEALRVIDSRIDALQGEIMSKAGERSVADTWQLRNDIRNLIDTTSGQEVSAGLRPALEARLRLLEQDRRQPIDPARQQMLEANLAALQAQFKANPNAPGTQRRIDAVMAAIDRNTGTAYIHLKDWRSDLGKTLDANTPGIKTRDQAQLYDPATEAMREQALKGGMTPAEFDAKQAETTGLYGQQPLIQKTAKAEDAQAYNTVFSPTNQQNVNLLNNLFENAPVEMRKAIADNIELKIRKENAGEVPSAYNIKPADIVDWWGSLPEAVQQRYAGGNQPTLQKLNDLRLLAEADARRPTRTKPTGGNTLGYSTQEVVQQLLPTVIGGSTGGLSGAVAGALIGQAPNLARYVRGRMFTGDFAPAAVAGRAPALMPELYQRLREGLAAQMTQDRNEPLRFTVKPKVGPPS